MTTATKTDMLREARRYHSLGWSIIGLLCGCKEADQRWKHYQEQRADDPQLRKWFASGDRQPAVVCGQVSGWLACRDFDQMGDYTRWAADNPVLAKLLPTVATPRPGRHVYHIDSTATGRIITLADGEYRGAGYCLLPPSTQTKGRYEWLVRIHDDGDIPEVDPVVAGLLPQASAVNTGYPGCASDYCVSVSPVYLCSLGTLCNGVTDAIARTVPTGRGFRRGRLFHFARILKSLPETAAADLSDLKLILRHWHATALPTIGTKGFDETWADFAAAWQAVKFPAGQEPIRMIYQQAIARPLPSAVEQYESPELRRLVALCRELQIVAGHKPFFLSCRTAGELLGISHVLANKWLRLMALDKVIVVVTAGSRNKAAEYRYTLEG